ncbi:MAG TPA: N-acetyl-gamma-glutamyl-phosphate reductase, partial [Candidatus Limnocylindrales bacterium]|nr:N-acetyl-gamma-glutamyl-phosphate reductase [Candidatus Limnocylindrales bacterium]
MSASETEAAIAADRHHEPPAPRSARAIGQRALVGDPVRVAIVGATGYVGAELIRLLALHPHVRIVGLVGRERKGDPIAGIHPHLATRDLKVYDAVPADAEAVFLALPHGAVAGRIDEFLDRGQTVIDLGPDFRLHDPADYPRWYHFEHPRADLLRAAVYGLPELHRAELAAIGRAPGAIVGSPGCYATTTILALAPLARAGLIADLVVDAKSGVSGAGRDPKADLHFGEVNESVKAYGIFTHRHIGEIEQELGALGGEDANPGVRGVDFLPQLVPMTRGILSACHVRPTRPVTQAELDALYRDAYGDEAFITVVDTAPATKHVYGSNEARVWCRVDERNGRVLAIGVLDNLVKGAAGQAIQAFNVVHGLPEPAGLLQLPL